MTAFATLVVAAAVATGLAGGVLFAFSTFVMGGLRRLSPGEGGAAMVAINRDALRPPLMLLLAASVLLPAAAAVFGLVGDVAGAGWALAGACRCDTSPSPRAARSGGGAAAGGG